MTSLPLTAELVGNTPIGTVVLFVSLAITAAWLYHIYS
jgi:hypothetical protein